jgi:hypothetical protein
MTSFGSRRRALGGVAFATPPLRGAKGDRGPPGPPGLGARTRVNPVYVEDYVLGYSAANDTVRATLRATAGVLRTAIIAALAANLTARKLVLPGDAWNWDKTQYLNEAYGLRDNLTIVGQGTEIYCDMAGATSGQVIMFMWNFNFVTPGAGVFHHDIHVRGVKFSFLNVVTSFFSSGWQVERATRCSIKDCEFFCTFANGASETVGHIRWGCGLYGDSLGPNNGGGRDNIIDHVETTNAEIEGCGGGRSARGVSITRIKVNNANDLGVSIVSSGAANVLENILIEDIQIFNVSGSGGILAGGDGNSPGDGVGVIRNYTIRNIQGSGSRTPDLAFTYGGVIIFNGGVVTENIIIDGIGNKLSGNTAGNAFSLNISGSPDQTDPHAWKGLTISNSDFGPVHETDPKQQVVVGAVGIDGVTLTNITCRGKRGLQLQNCDFLTCNNIVTDDGTFEVVVDRNLTSLLLSNLSLTRGSSFLYGLWFRTNSTNKNVASALLSNSYLRGNSQPGLDVQLAGGTIALLTSNVDVTGTLTAETLAGIVSSTNCPGIAKDRASFGAGKGYVDVVIDLPAQSAGAVSEISTTVAGSLAGDTYAISTLTAIDSTIVFCDARCRVAGTVVWRLLNISGTPNPASNTFRFALIARN